MDKQQLAGHTTMAGTTRTNNAIIALEPGKRSLRRKLLMASVLALAPAMGGAAEAQPSMQGSCVADGQTTTCTGDQSEGVYVSGGSKLVVEKLTASIGTSINPISDHPGISFNPYVDSKGSRAAEVFTLNSDTTGTRGGPSGIWVNDANGIQFQSSGDNALVLDSKGDITVLSGGYSRGSFSGIKVTGGAGDIDITSSSNITVTSDGSGSSRNPSAGIVVSGKGAITVLNTGDILASLAGGENAVDGINVISKGVRGAGGISQGQSSMPGATGVAGGPGRAGGAGGDIVVNSSGNLTVAGSNSAGIRAVSKGGKGGRGGNGGNGAAGANTNSVGGNGGAAGAGGDGGSGGDGGAVDVTASGKILGTGNGGIGIYAGSLGGKGGRGGAAGSAGAGGFGGEMLVQADSGSPADSGVAGNGGNGGKVTVISSATIDMQGPGSIGIKAERIGRRSSGDMGYASDVTVTNSGAITTHGYGSTGIAVSSQGGESGALTVVNNSGAITNAIPEDGGGSGYDISAGVAFNGGYDNFLNNSGTIDSAGIYDGNGFRFAVTANGNTAINNTGTINGSIDLIGLAPALIDTFGDQYTANTTSSMLSSSWSDFLALLHMPGNLFDNKQGGTFNAGIVVALGTGSTLTNSGNMTPGGDNGFGSSYLGSVGTALIGNFDQTATGRLNINLDVAERNAAGLYVLGNADLAGTIAVTPTTLGTDGFRTPIVSTLGLNTSNEEFPIFPADGLTNKGVTLLASPALHASLEWQNGSNDRELTSITAAPVDQTYTFVSLVSDGIDYQVDGLSPAEQQVADHLQTQLTPKSGDSNNDKLLLALLTPMELAQYKAALDQLTPTAGASSGGSSTTTSGQFTNALLSCRQATGAYAYIREGQCSWAQLKQRVTDRSQTIDAPGSRAYVTSLSAGVQKDIGRGWFAGFGLGFAHDDISNTDHASSAGNEAMAGVVVKYAPGPISLALALDAGMGWNDNKRSITLLNETASASNTQNHVGAQLRAAYLLDHGLWYAKPMVDFNATMLNIGGYTETGSSSNLTVMDSKTTILSISPGFEIGGQFKLANGSLVRPYTKLGTTFFGDTSIDTTAHLVGSTGDFNVTSTGDRTLVDLTGGLDILATDGMTLRLNTESHFGATTRDIAASAKVGWSF